VSVVCAEMKAVAKNSIFIQYILNNLLGLLFVANMPVRKKWKDNNHKPHSSNSTYAVNKKIFYMEKKWLSIYFNFQW